MAIRGLNNQYSSVMQALEEAEKDGFVNHFNFEGKLLRCVENGKAYKADEILVRQFHRVEGASDPDENAIIYFVETNDGILGTVINAYGAYADPEVDRLMKDVQISNNSQQEVPEIKFCLNCKTELKGAYCHVRTKR